MRENLRETLKETSALRNVSIEEGVLEGIENIDKACGNVLRSLRHVETPTQVRAFGQGHPAGAWLG